MKKSFVRSLMIVFIIFLVLDMDSHGDYYYDINSYNIDIVVNEDNSYKIVETIEVQFHVPRHGIYRKIPLDYNGRNNLIRDVVVYNPYDNRPYKTDLSKENNDLIIRIGDEAVYVENQVTYAIAYTYDGGIDFDGEKDEFYYNLIGTEWDCQIDRVTFNIEMPKTFDVQALNFTSGLRGSLDSGKVLYSVSDKIISGALIEPLNPFEALTIALPLEEGYYDGVETKVDMTAFYVLFVMMSGFLIVLLVYAARLKRQNQLVPIVSFTPPDDLNPPEVAYIFKRENLQLKDVATLILKWAAQGCLSIDETDRKGFKKGHMTLTRLKDVPGNKTSYERQLFKTMFNKGDGKVVTTDELAFKFYRNMTTVVHRVTKKFSGKKEVLINSYQVWTKVTALVYLLLSSLTIAYILTRFLRNSFLFNYLMVLLGGVLVFIVYGLVNYTKNNDMTLGSKFFIAVFGLSFGLPMLGIVVASVVPVIDLLRWNGSGDLSLFLIYILFQGITLVTLLNIKVYSPYAREKLGQILGFRAFIRTAKLDQLEMLYQDNPNYFYDILPYAMVLDLTDLWDDYVDKLTVTPPSWYTSTSGFNSHNFTSSMDRTFRSASAQPSSSGSSSSSSSGGSSGGGGGGGGGGSW